MPRRPLIAGNWKMNGARASLGALATIIEGLRARGAAVAGVDCAICPPATLLMSAADRAAGSTVALGGQDAHYAVSGAHTGDVSAEMLADAGAQLVVLGHSERRADHGETDALVHSKVAAAWRAGLTAILCVGESEDERDAGKAVEVVLAQLAGGLPDGADAERLVVAYEPVWAIGTGKVASVADIEAMHAAIRAALVSRLGAAGEDVRILYGGSVKPANAAEILAAENVDGALVGGASLKAEDFLAIVDAAA